MVIDGPSGPPDGGDEPPDRQSEHRHAAEMSTGVLPATSIGGEPASHVTADIHIRQRSGPGRRFDAPC